MMRFYSCILFICIIGFFHVAWAAGNPDVMVKNLQSYGEHPDGPLDNPVDVVIDSDGYYYISNAGGHFVSKHDPVTGELVKKFYVTRSDGSPIMTPLGLSIDDSDHIYIADPSLSVMVVIDADGNYITEFGGDLVGPRMADVDPQGNTHVMDEFGNQIVVFDPDGNQISQCTNPKFNFPNGLAYDSEKKQYYVTNTNAFMIMILDENCQEIKTIGEASGNVGGILFPGEFSYPRKLILNNDKLYIADSLHNRIAILDTDLNFLDEISVPINTLSVAFNKNGDIAVPSAGESAVLVYDKDNPMNRIATIGIPRNQPGTINGPMGLDVDMLRNEVYVVDQYNSRINVYRLGNERFLRSFGQYGSGENPGDLYMPNDVDVIGNRVYVTSTYTNDIVIFTRQGKFVKRWADTGYGSGQFVMPYDIEHDKDYIYLTDMGSNRIQVFTHNHEYVRQIGYWGYTNDAYFTPRRLKITKDNKLFVTDTYGSKVLAYDLNNDEHLFSFGQFGYNEGDLFLPYGIDTDTFDKYLIIGEAGNFRISVFTTNGKFVTTAASIGTGKKQVFFMNGLKRCGGNDTFCVTNFAGNRVDRLWLGYRYWDWMNRKK